MHDIAHIMMILDIHKYLADRLLSEGYIALLLKPSFHYTANATTTTQKQSDYKVEQSSFKLIALFSLKIGRCRGRNWLNGNQALRSLLRHFMVDIKTLLEIPEVSQGNGE